LRLWIVVVAAKSLAKIHAHIAHSCLVDYSAFVLSSWYFLCSQGSSWSRSKLKFATHDSSPPTLSTRIAPGDVKGLQECLPDNCSSSSSSVNNGNDDPTRQSADPTAAAAAAAAAGCSLHHYEEYVLYSDSSKTLTVIPTSTDSVLGMQSPGAAADAVAGLTVQLAAAASDVVTVAPVLELQKSSSSSGSVKFAVIGLTNMLNPGGAVMGVVAGSSSSSRGAGSDGGSSHHSSDSWVVTEGASAPGDQSTAAAAAAATAESGGDGNGSAGAGNPAGVAAYAAAVQGSATVQLSVLGCGQLLLYVPHSPAAVLLDGQPAEFEFNGDSCSLVVAVPEPATAGSAAQQVELADLQHAVIVRFE
jgi:hypothetical protein